MEYMSASTVDAILKLLDTHGQATAAEIAEALHLSRADIRYHLQEMLTSDTVEVVEIRQPVSRGRPARVFRLPSANDPRAIHALFAAFLHQLQSQPEDKRDSALTDLTERVFQLEQNRQPSLALRVVRLLNIMNTLGYKTGWEIHSGCTQISFHACPFCKSAATFASLCRMDQLALDAVAGSPVGVKSLIANGSATCVFEIKS